MLAQLAEPDRLIGRQAGDGSLAAVLPAAE
jgi:hypothetical protein